MQSQLHRQQWSWAADGLARVFAFLLSRAAVRVPGGGAAWRGSWQCWRLRGSRPSARGRRSSLAVRGSPGLLHPDIDHGGAGRHQPATSHRQPSIDPGLSEAAPASPAPVAPLPNFKCPSGERGGGGAGRGAEGTQPTAPLSAHIPTCCRLSHNNIDFYPTGHLGHRNRSG